MADLKNHKFLIFENDWFECSADELKLLSLKVCEMLWINPKQSSNWKRILLINITIMVGKHNI